MYCMYYSWVLVVIISLHFLLLLLGLVLSSFIPVQQAKFHFGGCACDVDFNVLSDP